METLEEAVERIFEDKDRNYVSKIFFMRGAEWQKEQIGKSEFLQKLRATKSDAEARRIIKTI